MHFSGILNSFTRDRVGFDAVDLHVAPREIVALVGPADAGKTVILETLLHQRSTGGGHPGVAGLDATVSALGTSPQLAYVPAAIELPADRTGLAHAQASCRLDGRRIPEGILEASLIRGGLALPWHGRRIGSYPPAQRRTLAFTLAVLKNPDALILDDPTRDLFGADFDGLVRSLRRLRKRGMAVLMATRDLGFARRVATRIVLLERGCVIETINPNASRRAFQAGSYLGQLVG